MTSEFILLLPSSVHINEPIPGEAIQAQTMILPQPCFTDKLVCLVSSANPFFLHTNANLALCSYC